MRSDTRLAMREFRFLDEKRKLTRLKETEERRWLELKQTLSAPTPLQPAGNHPAGTNGYPAPLPKEGLPQSAAELLGLLDAEAPDDEVIQLDAGDVTMLEPDSNAAPDEAEIRSEAASEADVPAIALLPSDAVDGEFNEPFATHPTNAPSPAAVALQKLTRSTDPFGIPISVANASPAPPAVALEVDRQAENPWPPSSLEIPLEIRTDQATVLRVSPDREGDEPVRAVPLEPDSAQLAVAWQSQVPGEHRVIIHLLDGQVKRGIVQDLDLTGSSVHLQEPELAEDIPFDQIKAVFFMGTSSGGHLPEAQKIRVTLTDGRQLTGYSTDYKQSGTGFFLEPSDTRTNTSRIFLLRAGVEKIGEE